MHVGHLNWQRNDRLKFWWEWWKATIVVLFWIFYVSPAIFFYFTCPQFKLIIWKSPEPSLCILAPLNHIQSNIPQIILSETCWNIPQLLLSCQQQHLLSCIHWKMLLYISLAKHAKSYHHHHHHHQMETYRNFNLSSTKQRHLICARIVTF